MSDLTICNKALSMIGGRATIASLAEGSKEAAVCNLWYDDTRLMLLRAAHWSFARKQVLLTELGNAQDQTAPQPWAFLYEYPTDCVKMRYLFPYVAPVENNDVVVTGDFYWPSYGWMMPSRASRFLISQATWLVDDEPVSGKAIVSNLFQAMGVYTADISDTTQFDQGFEDALVSALAAAIVIPLNGNVQMKGVWEQLATDVVNRARAVDGNEAMPSTDHTPDWLRERGAGGIFPSPFGYGDMGMWYQGWDTLAWGE